MRPRLDNTYHGKPCKHGHTLRRIGGSCIECGRTQARAWNAANPTRNAEWWVNKKQKGGPNYDAARVHAEKMAMVRRERLKQLANTRNQRVDRLGATGEGVTARQWDRIERDACGLCVYCGQPKSLTLDHIDPLARGGTHDPDNAVAVCLDCNISKQDKPLLVWMALRRIRRQAAA